MTLVVLEVVIGTWSPSMHLILVKIQFFILSLLVNFTEALRAILDMTAVDEPINRIDLIFRRNHASDMIWFMSPEQMRKEGLILEAFNVNERPIKNIVIESDYGKGWIGFIVYYDTNEYEVFSRRNLVQHYNAYSSTIYVEIPKRSLIDI